MLVICLTVTRAFAEVFLLFAVGSRLALPRVGSGDVSVLLVGCLAPYVAPSEHDKDSSRREPLS
jgi:hypothetical protein